MASRGWVCNGSAAADLAENVVGLERVGETGGVDDGGARISLAEAEAGRVGRRDVAGAGNIGEHGFHPVKAGALGDVRREIESLADIRWIGRRASRERGGKEG